MGNFESIARHRYPTGSNFIVHLYKYLSCKWHANNGDGFLENTNCYKIHCFDECDDVVDVFSSHHHEVARRAKRHNYNSTEWTKFYHSLMFVYEIEHELYQLFENDRQTLKEMNTQMVSSIEQAEKQLANEPTKGPQVSPILRTSLSDHRQVIGRNYTLIFDNFNTFDKEYSLNFIRETIKHNQKGGSNIQL